MHVETRCADYQQPTPTLFLAPSAVWTPQHMTFSLDPHPQRVEINNSILANTVQENPVPLVKNHSDTAHVGRKRAVILLELLNSVSQKTSFSPVLG